MDEANSPDWTAIRAAYESGEGSVEGLCKTHGVAKTALYIRRRRERWALRNRVDSSNPATRGNRRRVMVARFFEALEQQIHEIESSLQREAAQADTSATSRERAARTLSSLVRTLEKLFELDTSADPAAEARKEAAHRDIEGLRQALAERIARLGRERQDR